MCRIVFRFNKIKQYKFHCVIDSLFVLFSFPGIMSFICVFPQFILRVIFLVGSFWGLYFW